MPVPLRIPNRTKIHKTQRLQEEFKEARPLYRETDAVEKALTKKIVDAIEKKYLQTIDNLITKSITNPIFKVIQNLFDNYDQVRQSSLNKHELSVKSIVYTLNEPSSTVFTQTEDLRMLEKAAKNP